MSEQTMKVTLYGATFFAAERDQFVSVFIGQPAEVGSQSAKGIEVMKISCDPEVFQGLPADPSSFPMPVEMVVRLKRAGGGKLGQHCTRITPQRASGPARASA